MSGYQDSVAGGEEGILSRAPKFLEIFTVKFPQSRSQFSSSY